jgi:hypothetical protein
VKLCKELDIKFPIVAIIVDIERLSSYNVGYNG